MRTNCNGDCNCQACPSRSAKVKEAARQKYIDTSRPDGRLLLRAAVMRALAQSPNSIHYWENQEFHQFLASTDGSDPLISDGKKSRRSEK